MKRIVKETGVRDVVTKSLRKTKSAGHKTRFWKSPILLLSSKTEIDGSFYLII